MSANDQITVSTDNLRQSALDLRQLTNDWDWKSSSAVSINNFRESEGLSTDTMDEYAELTHLVAASVKELFENTRGYFVAVSDSFSKADLAAAEMIQDND